MLAGEIDPAALFETPFLIDRFRAAIQAELSDGRRGAREKATLAFHLLTVPQVTLL